MTESLPFSRNSPPICCGPCLPDNLAPSDFSIWPLDLRVQALGWAGMIVELINTGSELMLGRVLNTHQQWLCRQLADRGYVVSRQVAVPDAGTDIEQAVREALGRADLVIATGGLGPTSDDVTRDLVAQLLGKALREDAEVLAHIRSFFESRKRYMPERIKVQALVPGGAIDRKSVV